MCASIQINEIKVDGCKNGQTAKPDGKKEIDRHYSQFSTF
jgi:hypothetical protein